MTVAELIAALQEMPAGAEVMVCTWAGESYGYPAKVEGDEDGVTIWAPAEKSP